MKVSGKREINVVLKEDTETLDEVVVVGFGTQKKVNLTGAVGLATAKELESRPVTSATQALQDWYLVCRYQQVRVNWTRPQISVSVVQELLVRVPAVHLLF